MCGLLTTTPMAPSIHPHIWGLNVHVFLFVACIYVCAFLPECLLKHSRVSLPTNVLFCDCFCVCVFLVVVNKSACQHMCCVAFALNYLMPRQYSVRIRRPATSA